MKATSDNMHFLCFSSPKLLTRNKCCPKRTHTPKAFFINTWHFLPTFGEKYHEHPSHQRNIPKLTLQTQKSCKFADWNGIRQNNPISEVITQIPQGYRSPQASAATKEMYCHWLPLSKATNWCSIFKNGLQTKQLLQSCRLAGLSPSGLVVVDPPLDVLQSSSATGGLEPGRENEPGLLRHHPLSQWVSPLTHHLSNYSKLHSLSVKYILQ